MRCKEELSYKVMYIKPRFEAILSLKLHPVIVVYAGVEAIKIRKEIPIAKFPANTQEEIIVMRRVEILTFCFSPLIVLRKVQEEITACW